MPVKPDVEGIKASFALWLYLTIHPDWNALFPGPPATIKPIKWDAGNLNSNLSALEASGQAGAVKKILDWLSNNKSTIGGGNLSYWDHFRGVQAAFQEIFAPPATPGTSGVIQSPYPINDPDCPSSILYVSQLQLTYPAGFNPPKVREVQ